MNPIFVAIDTPDLERAKLLAEQVRANAGGVKLGLEFFSANGPAGVAAILELGLPVFLDLKLHDIPNTVAKAVEALAPLEPAVLTVHAAGGRAMLEAAKAAAPAEHEGRGGDGAHQPRRRRPALASASRPSRASRSSGLPSWRSRPGLDGIVCSGAEVAAARAAWPDGFFVVPGVRPAGGDVSDQKRVVTPRQALDDGASILVIGRPITGADDPAAALRDIAATL